MQNIIEKEKDFGKGRGGGWIFVGKGEPLVMNCFQCHAQLNEGEQSSENSGVDQVV